VNSAESLLRAEERALWQTTLVILVAKNKDFIVTHLTHWQDFY
jgi:hypothetical protein